MYLKDIIEEIEKLEKQFREEVNTIMTEIPEADGLKRLNKNCFTISFKSLNNMNLSPEYYDTRRQIQLLKEKLKRCKTVDGIKERLQECIQTKTLEVTKDYKIKLHDLVLEKLNEIILAI